MSPAVKRVIAVLRRDVLRPSSVPGRNFLGRLRWPGPSGDVSGLDAPCALGLHPGCRHPEPDGEEHLPGVAGLEPGDVMAFGRWWDRQTSPAAAVAAVWGPTR